MGHLKIFNVNICRCAQLRAFPILARKYLDVTIRRPFGARAKVTGVRGHKNLPVAGRRERLAAEPAHQAAEDDLPFAKRGWPKLLDRGALCEIALERSTPVVPDFLEDLVSRKHLDNMSLTYTKALSPVIALPTINVFISRVPS